MPSETFLQRLARADKRPILADSATGTWFQNRVKDEAGKCCDGYNLSNPDVVRQMYREKIEAGAELVLTNTFNSCILRLPEFGLEDEHALARRIDVVRADLVSGLEREAQPARRGAAVVGAAIE